MSETVDGRDIALVEWSRFEARVAAHRRDHSLDGLQSELREIAAHLEEAADKFDRQEEGRLISVGEGT